MAPIRGRSFQSSSDSFDSNVSKTTDVIIAVAVIVPVLSFIFAVWCVIYLRRRRRKQREASLQPGQPTAFKLYPDKPEPTFQKPELAAAETRDLGLDAQKATGPATTWPYAELRGEHHPQANDQPPYSGNSQVHEISTTGAEHVAMYGVHETADKTPYELPHEPHGWHELNGASTAPAAR